MKNRSIMLIAATMAVMLLQFAIEAWPEKDSAVVRLSRGEMMALAHEKVIEEFPQAEVAPLSSHNQHLGGKREIQNPFKSAFFGCALCGQTLVAPIRKYICVTEKGQVLYPFDANQFADVLTEEDWDDWNDEQILQAAELFVHLSSVANEDGWKILDSPDEFMEIKFNMFDNNADFRRKREYIAQKIEAAQVIREDDAVTVRFFTWHLIGGQLLEWTIQFRPTFKATWNNLGQFGGGGYD